MKEIELTRGKVALVDDDIESLLKGYRWNAHYEGHTWYALRTTSKKYGDLIPHKVVRMHRVVLPPPCGFEIDHINGDGLDNRRCNLRIVTRRQNLQNLHINKSSKYPGVCFDKQCGKWLARMRISGKRIHLGHYATEQEAAIAYASACRGDRYD